MIEKDVNNILLSLYIILAREKIAVSNPTQINRYVMTLHAGIRVKL